MHMGFLRTNFRALIFHFLSGFSGLGGTKREPKWPFLQENFVPSLWGPKRSEREVLFSRFSAHFRSIFRVSCSLSLHFQGFLDFFSGFSAHFRSIFASFSGFFRFLPGFSRLFFMIFCNRFSIYKGFPLEMGFSADPRFFPQFFHHFSISSFL